MENEKAIREELAKIGINTLEQLKERMKTQSVDITAMVGTNGNNMAAGETDPAQVAV